MKKIGCIFLVLICVCGIIPACNLTGFNSNKPEDIALEFTRIYFTQIPYSKNYDYSKDSNQGANKTPSDVLKPFGKLNVTESVMTKLSEFYKGGTPPALQFNKDFYAKEQYRIQYVKDHGRYLEYGVTAINVSKKSFNNELLIGLIVNIDVSGDRPKVSYFKYDNTDTKPVGSTIPEGSNKKIDMLGFGMPEILMVGAVIAVVIVTIFLRKRPARKSESIPIQSENSKETATFDSNPAKSLNKLTLLIILVLLVGGGYYFYNHSSMRVTDNMVIFAKELSKKIYSDRAGFGFGALHPRTVTISKMDVIEVGESSNKILPVKFHIVGELKTQEDKADASSFPIRLSVEDVVKPIDENVVYYFSKDEFSKRIVCDESKMNCIKEN